MQRLMRGGVFVSTNNGGLWTNLGTNGLTNTYTHAVAVSGTNIFVGLDYGGGVCLLTNSASSWTAVNNGLINTQVNALATIGTTVFAGVSGGGVYLSTNNGNSWTPVNNGLWSSYVETLAIMGTNIFAGTLSGVFLSTNNGNSWTSVNNGLTNLQVYALAISGTNIFAGTYGGGVFLSTNNGSSWTAVNNGLTNTQINSLAISGASIVAGTQSDVFLSTNNGSSWTALNIGIPNNPFNSVAVEINGTNIFFGGGAIDGIYSSNDNGNTWTHEDSLGGITAFAINGTNIFAAGGNWGVVLSTNNGNSWTNVGTGFPFCNGFSCVYGWSLAISGTNVFAGSLDDGVWIRPLTEMVAGINEISNDNAIVIIYPNPFSTSATIEIKPEFNNQQMEFKMYDVLGKEIRNIFFTGTKTTVERENLKDGIYFYSIASKNKIIATGKLIVSQ